MGSTIGQGRLKSWHPPSTRERAENLILKFVINSMFKVLSISTVSLLQYHLQLLRFANVACRSVPLQTIQEACFKHSTFALERCQNEKILVFQVKIHCLLQSEINRLHTRMSIIAKVCEEEKIFPPWARLPIR